MKQILAVCIMLVLAFWIDVKPVDMKQMQKDTMTVIVKGEVDREEHLELPLYASIQDALDKVRLKPNADISSLNPTTVLKDKDVLIIPSYNEKPKISINTADVETLSTLSGIGRSTAEKIISYRNENGLFQTIEDLMKVKGIGRAKFEKLKDEITL